MNSAGRLPRLGAFDFSLLLDSSLLREEKKTSTLGNSQLRNRLSGLAFHSSCIMLSLVRRPLCVYLATGTCLGSLRVPFCYPTRCPPLHCAAG